MIAPLVDIATAASLVALAALAATAIPGLVREIRRSPVEAVLLTGTVVLGLGLRLGAPAFPARWDTPLNAAMEPLGDPGGAWVAFLRLLWLGTGPSDASAFAANALVGAASIVAVHVMARRMGVGIAGALFGAAFFATHAAHLRYSHTDSPVIAQALLMSAAAAVLVRPETRLARVGAGIALGLGLAIRPEGLLLAPFWVALPWAAGRKLEREDAWVLAGMVPALPALGAALPDVLARLGTTAISSPRFMITDVAWMALSFKIAALLGPFARADRRVRAWLLAVALVGMALAWFGPEVDYEKVEAQLVALPALAILAGLGLELVLVGLWDRTRVVAVIAGLLVPIPIARHLSQPYESVAQPSALAAVYKALDENLGAVEPGCTVLYVVNPLDPTVGPASRLSAQRGLDHTWVDLGTERQPYDECQIYYRSPACYLTDAPQPTEPAPDSTHPIADACKRWEKQLTDLEPLELRGGSDLPTGSEVFTRATEPLSTGFFSLVPPIDPTKPKPSVPPPPRTADSVAQKREQLANQIRSLPAWTPPAGWDLVVLAEVLESSTCSADDIRCSSDLCVAISTDPDCQRSAWHAATREVGPVEVSRFTWADEADGFQASAIALIPTSAREDQQVIQRVNAMAHLLLLDALYP